MQGYVVYNYVVYNYDGDTKGKYYIGSFLNNECHGEGYTAQFFKV